MMDYDDLEEDLPWDGLWEYVLGDDVDDEMPRQRQSSFRRQRSNEVSTEVTQYLLSEDTRKESREKKQSETKKRLTFPRQSSFTRQASNQSTSTNGSTSSRLKGLLGRRKKKGERVANDSSQSVFQVFSGGKEESTRESRDDSGLSRTRTRDRPPSLLQRLSSSFDDGREEPQDVLFSSHKKEKKKPFWRKRDTKNSQNADSSEFSFSISPIGVFGSDPTDQAPTNKKEKRRSFWKRNEKSQTTNQEWDGGNSDDESSELESIDGLLGPWEGGSAAVNNKGDDQVSGATSPSLRSSFKKKSTESEQTHPTAESAPRRDSKTTGNSKARASLLKAVTRMGARGQGRRERNFRESLKNNYKQNGDSRRVGGDEPDEDMDTSFLPPSLLHWQNEEEIRLQHSKSTDSTKTGSLSNQNDSSTSSVSDISDQGLAKKEVTWADDLQSIDQESEDDLGVSFAGIKAWLYSTLSSSDEDSESSITSSQNQSFQSEDLSSAPTESDVSISGVSSKEESDGEDARDNQQTQPAVKGQEDPSKQNELLDDNEINELVEDHVAFKEPSSPSPRQSIKDTEGIVARIEPQESNSEGRKMNWPDIASSNPKDSEMEIERVTKITAVPTNKMDQGMKNKKERGKRRPEKKTRRKRTPEQRILFCKALRNLTDEDIVKAMESGVPVHELTFEELAEIFPKIRMVSDEHIVEQTSLVLGNANSFDDSLPALLQVPAKAIRPALGLQSLYEYDFSSGKHMNITYDSYGADPKSSLIVNAYDSPPESSEPCYAIIQVEASTISTTDCRIRRDGWFGRNRVELPNTPGVDIVGKIYRIDYESSTKLGLNKGDRVVSLVSQGGNSRFVSLKASSLVKISEKVDPAEATSLVETYLAAFQTLHMNHSFLTRYRKNSLHGKTILVIGGMSINMARALSQLAQYAGAKSVFATGRKKDFKYLSENGILPLPTDPVEWWEQLAGAVDILISLDEEVIPLHHKLLKLDGMVVVSSTEFHHERLNDGSSSTQRKLICSTARARALSKTTPYDLYEEWESNPVRAKKDLAYLVGLLEKRKIIPKVIDRVPLDKVAEIQELLEKRRAKGHYVCEPWLVSKSRAVSL